MKQIAFLLLCLCATGAGAQGVNNIQLRKLQMAEFAISRLYVDTVNESRLVEHAITNPCKATSRASASSSR